MGTGSGENIGKPFYFNLPPDIGFTLFTPIKGRIDSRTVYIYKAETCTIILRYNTCMSSLSWRPEVDDNGTIMVVQPAIVTYPTMVCYLLLGPQVLWNDLRGIVIKQRHRQTF